MEEEEKVHIKEDSYLRVVPYICPNEQCIERILIHVTKMFDTRNQISICQRIFHWCCSVTLGELVEKMSFIVSK